MIKHKLVFSIAAIVSFGFLPSPEKSDNSNCQLLFVRTYHGNEVSATSGEKWFGLFQEKKEYKLREVIISVKRVHDIISDENGSNPTGKEVSVSGKSKPLFLVKGSNEFKAGEVKTLFWGNRNLVEVRRSSFVMGDSTKYLLSTQGKAKDSYGVYIENFKLVLRANGISQVIASLPGTDTDGPPSLMWIGDLDGDRKLDLLVNLTTHYNLTIPTLFLSSVADSGKLVKMVASIRSGGC